MSEEWSDPNKVGGKYMAGVIADFAPALKEIAKLGSMNNKPNGKYARGSWKLVENPEVEYGDAFWRHLLEGSHEIDPDTKMPHDVAIAWNALALVCFRLEREKQEAQDLIDQGFPGCILEDEDDADPILCPVCRYVTNYIGVCMNPECEGR